MQINPKQYKSAQEFKSIRLLGPLHLKYMCAYMHISLLLLTFTLPLNQAKKKSKKIQTKKDWEFHCDLCGQNKGTEDHPQNPIDICIYTYTIEQGFLLFRVGSAKFKSYTS